MFWYGRRSMGCDDMISCPRWQQPQWRFCCLSPRYVPVHFPFSVPTKTLLPNSTWSDQKSGWLALALFHHPAMLSLLGEISGKPFRCHLLQGWRAVVHRSISFSCSLFMPGSSYGKHLALRQGDQVESLPEGKSSLYHSRCNPNLVLGRHS